MERIPKKILIARTDRIGDVILSTPVIRNLKLHFPKAHISFMCRPYTRNILEENPYLDEIIIYDKYKSHKSLWASIKFSLYLRKKKFDWAIILHPTNRVNLITFLAGVPLRAGWDKKMGYLLTKKIFHDKQEGKKHEMEYTLDILKKLDIPIKDKTTYFPVPQKAIKKVEQLLNKYKVGKKENLIVLHPSASCPSKRWPQEHFSKLIPLLKENFASKIAVITSLTEKKLSEKIVEENEVIDLRGKLNISEIGALLKRAKLFISNDSGPVHIAASLNIPVISIFGRKNPGLSPERWKPLGRNSFYLHKDAGCEKCLAHNCQKEFSCLKSITPQDVIKKAHLIKFI